jgi:hypothetical protein
MQDMVVVISLKAEDEFSIEVLHDDLNSTITTPLMQLTWLETSSI